MKRYIERESIKYFYNKINKTRGVVSFQKGRGRNIGLLTEDRRQKESRGEELKKQILAIKA